MFLSQELGMYRQKHIYVECNIEQLVNLKLICKN